MQRKLPKYQQSLTPKALTWRRVRWFLSRTQQRIAQRPPAPWQDIFAESVWSPYRQILLSYLGSFLGIAVLAYLTIHSGYPLIAAPFGATAVLVFAVPDSPMAQPRNVLGGNCLAAITCVLLVQLFGTEPWVMALAVATAIKLMQLTQTLHPPGGAIALLGVMSQASWDFVWIPVLVGSVVLVVCTIVFNNLVPGRTYPKRWF
ncbi:HPP family protein [Oscillatoria sp. FACHB-1407]|uniref:HPP family protein n=1 Tax=Oscillatoria sp. FACHB-1407 TaxID=2692847 RepID=UPI001681FAE0|nr:HPP family protein [Oscillatoria sp. FACHB-1407]MBD2464682.1 HPP family protein [Oscillatoria sp. FACHB-1407]